MCIICIEYNKGAISKQEALINLQEMIFVAIETEDQMLDHLEHVEQDLLEEDTFEGTENETD